jgi:Tol biopolymer transport system component
MTKVRACALGAALFAIAACGNVANVPDAPPVPDARPPDATPPRCDVSKPFGAPVLLTDLNSAQNDDYVWLPADELTVYVGSERTGGLGAADLWIATRASASAAFGTLTDITSLDSTAYDERPSLTADGLAIFFDSNRGTDGHYDIYIATRADVSADFGPPSPVTAINAANANDQSPTISADGTVLYFMSDRAGGAGGFDLYRATRANTSTPFGTPTAVAELNSANNDEDPVVSADGLTIFFESDRAGGPGSLDILKATRATTSDGFGTPVLVTELNTPTGDWVTWLSADGCRLYGGNNATNAAGKDDLWLATRPL